MKKKGIILCVVIGVALLVGGGAYVYANSQPTPAVAVKTAPLSKSTLQNTISATGVIESYNKVKISDTSNDKIEKIYVSVGQWVAKDDWLCQLYNKADDSYSYVKATTNGTITAMNAVKGNPANGELFTIEDTNDLKVRGKVKEADLNHIHENMPVLVKSDATGDKVFPGNLTKIAPTAIKSEATTASAAATKAEFEVEIDLPTDTTGLKIGMTTRLSIVSEERADVFCVPFEALVMDDSGQSCIYVAKENPVEQGSFTVESIPVTTGLETDSLIEIAGDQLSEGLVIISQPQTVQPGMVVSVEAGA
ncbi:HlyD family efflux transporter periplasmic adaptor subunit [Acetobacterium malicum]|uniref:HlyD family efflux transporter periplasmic adaptor subunit n=1 Tax=Acetobacterium malicum TaxID=52692 RepID=A0ABR6YZ84_9FIRM|nr:HlyD family efflux transporter periplasmic adaptor subunit [Acetobacterium malicum]MBC3900560.1 HlyD family efflux transporter periplasmic adaptor subunit [Acetobacterium malicum]MDD3307875.1 HlyD family efflux transporter periplasmic adaptor subunit [Acetobacterium sp.]